MMPSRRRLSHEIDRWGAYRRIDAAVSSTGVATRQRNLCLCEGLAISGWMQPYQAAAGWTAAWDTPEGVPA
jgi:hypothetical protein